MKLIILTILVFSLNVYAKNNKLNSTFFDTLSNELTPTLDSNITDKLKLQNIKDYITQLKFNDTVDKSKYTFNIMGHYDTFMLFGGHSSTQLTEKHWSNGVRDTTNDYQRDSNEAQYQLSIKVPLYSNFLNTDADLFTAYTQNAFWQVYNTDHSSPFRETNYMPELFLEWQPNKKFGDSKLLISRLSLIHQSNGRDVGQSRSWNRTELFFLFNNDNIYYGLHMWDRWDEKPKDTSNPLATTGDDNMGLESYIGKQRYFVKYKSNNFNAEISHQNNILNYDINRGNTKLDITLPSLNSNLDFFIRYFDGYGESLIDYDVKIKRVSFGIMIASWI